MRIFIIEDEVTLNKMLAEGLKEFGYQSDVVETLKDGEYYLDIRNYDLVLICKTPNSHIKLAIDSLQDGSNVFVEKPLSSNLIGISKLRNIIKKNDSLAFIGYNFRFNEGINLIKELVTSKKLGKVLHASAYFGQYLPDWRPLQDYRKNYSFLKNLGGGIIHDSSHEIDYLCWILGKPISLQSDFVTSSTFKTNVESLAEIILKFNGNVLANVHLDFIRREYKRSLELLFENGIINWSLKENKLNIFDVKKKTWNKIKTNGNINDMYVKEITHVLDCVKHNRKSKIIDIEYGLTSLMLSQLLIKAGKTGKRITLNK